jgi:hypothetical protein
MASLHKIKNIPATVFKTDGVETMKVVGVLSMDKIEEIINEVNITK